MFGIKFENSLSMKFQILTATLLLSLSLYSQSRGKITITSKGELPVYLLINDALQNEVVSDTLHVEMGYGSFNFKVIYADSLLFSEKNIFIQINEHLHYEFFKQDTLLDLKLVGQYLGAEHESNIFQFNSSSKNTYERLVSLLNNEEFVKELFVGTDNYQGKKGCEKPDYINKFALIEKINDAYLTRQKVKLIDEAFLGNCLKVSDMKDILRTIDYEDIRLELLSKYKASVFDIDNFKELKSLFTIKQHQEAFNKLNDQYE